MVPGMPSPNTMGFLESGSSQPFHDGSCSPPPSESRAEEGGLGEAQIKCRLLLLRSPVCTLREAATMITVNVSSSMSYGKRPFQQQPIARHKRRTRYQGSLFCTSSWGGGSVRPLAGLASRGMVQALVTSPGVSWLLFGHSAASRNPPGVHLPLPAQDLAPAQRVKVTEP